MLAQNGAARLKDRKSRKKYSGFLNPLLSCDIHGRRMKPLTLNLGRYPRFALLLLMLAAQGVATAHDFGDTHTLKSDPCSTCIIGQGVGSAITASHELPTFNAYTAWTPARAIAAALASRTDSHQARAPPTFSWNA